MTFPLNVYSIYLRIIVSETILRKIYTLEYSKLKYLFQKK